MRTTTMLLTALAACAAGVGANAGPAAYSNFTHFGNGDVAVGQASAVTQGNAPIVVPFASNTASMRVALDQAAAITTVRVLSAISYLPNQAPPRPGAGLGAEGGADLDGRPSLTTASGPIDLGDMRISFYASAADAASRTAFASVNIGAASVGADAWGVDGAFMQFTFDLGATIDLSAGQWFVEVAQVDPMDAAYFLAVREGSGLHLFDPADMSYDASGLEFALELDRSVAIPLPAAGSLAVAGLVAVGARVRRRRAF